MGVIVVARKRDRQECFFGDEGILFAGPLQHARPDYAIGVADALQPKHGDF